MKQTGTKNIILSIITAGILFFCLALYAFASENDTVRLKASDSDTVVTIKAIEQNGVSHLFLPAGTTPEALTFSEGDSISNYETMTDENIGSLHFFSDDPVNMGMDYINGSYDHSTAAPGRVILMDEDLNVEYEGAVDAIKGRGNRTWRTNKKPYQIKLSEKANLLDPGDDSQKAKKWILLANAFDNTLIRNQIAYSMAKELGLGSSPEGRQVDLYYDGEYCGVYYLCEKVEIGKGRVEINDLDKDPEGITGGYLMELDNAYYDNEECNYFKAPPAGAIVIKSPEEPSEAQFDYISGFVGKAMAVISSEGKDEEGRFVLFDYFDRESLLKYFLVMSWINNEDAFYSSTYLYKPEDEEKLYFGPVWDCDYSMGTRSSSIGYNVWLLRGMARSLMNMPEFRQALSDVYISEMSGVINDILLGQRDGVYLKSFQTIRDQMKVPAAMNYKALDVRHNISSSDSYLTAMDGLESWLVNRSSWVGNIIISEAFSPAMKLSVPKVKVKSRKGKLYLSWKKVTDASGYQIKYRRKAGNSKWRYKTVNGSSVTIKNLRRKKKYVVRVRAFCQKNSKTYYSKWSKSLISKTK